jgi:hypothetical protein
MPALDPIILGDNQFFGINHRSEDKALALLQRFQSNDEILKVIDSAIDAGIRGFTFSTHGRVAGLCDRFRADKSRYGSVRFYPAIPYAHKYAELVNEKGIPGAIQDSVISGSSFGDVAGMIARGGAALLTKDALKAMPLIVDLELKSFRDLNVGVVFLQNIVTDLLIGLGWTDAVALFAEHVRKRHGVEPGFITLNLPAALDFLERAGVRNPVVCSAINRLGFQMNPSREACERAIRTRTFQPVAMSILAAGALRPADAAAYVGSLPLKSVMFGASSAANIRDTKQLLEKYPQFATT